MSYRVAEYSHFKDLDCPGEWDSGILTIDLDHWSSFHEVTGKLLEIGDFIWRGQKQNWKLKSKFDRIVTSNRKSKLEEHKKSFVRAIRGRRGNTPPEFSDEYSIWSLGQHYGLATPLLDWTESPFVAAYFAFREKSIDSSQETPSRFIYGLSKDLGRWGPSKSPNSGPYDQFIKFVEPVSDENPRLLSQRGLFTIPMSEEVDIENTVQRCYAADPKKGKSRIIFVRVKILEIDRKTCLRNLNAMNINHATLFPDLIGAAEYCNVKLDIEDYG